MHLLINLFWLGLLIALALFVFRWVILVLVWIAIGVCALIVLPFHLIFKRGREDKNEDWTV